MSDKRNKLDPDFKYKVAEKPGGNSVKVCYSCGVCTASCPVNEVHEEFNPRKLIRMILLGDKEAVLNSDVIWYCILCERCYANCPQKVNFAHITKALRSIAIEGGYFSKSVESRIRSIDTLIAALREKLITEVLKDKDHIEKIDLNKKLSDIVSKLD